MVGRSRSIRRRSGGPGSSADCPPPIGPSPLPPPSHDPPIPPMTPLERNTRRYELEAVDGERQKRGWRREKVSLAPINQKAAGLPVRDWRRLPSPTKPCGLGPPSPASRENAGEGLGVPPRFDRRA